MLRKNRENVSSKISVVIPVYNGADQIRPCLTALLSQTYSGEIEIIVVDNNSTDNTKNIILQHDVEYVFEQKQGPSAARNAGIKKSTGDFLLFIDADCIARNDLVENHIKFYMEKQTDSNGMYIAGGAIKGINKNIWAVCDDLNSWYSYHPKLKERVEKKHVPTANMFFSSSIIEKVGYFDESLFFGEDVHYCMRVQRSGGKILFTPDAIVSHVNRDSFSYLFKHVKQWAIGMKNNKQNNVTHANSESPKAPWSNFVDHISYLWKSNRYYLILFLPLIIFLKFYFYYCVLTLDDDN